MTQHADILDQREPLSGAAVGSLALHVTIVAGIGIYGWMSAHTQSFGAQDAGGASVGVEAVNTIPLPHQGPKNPVANDTDSQVPHAPAKAVEKVKEKAPPPDAIPLKSKSRQRLVDQAAAKQKFPSFKDLENQVYSNRAPAVSSPLYAAAPGAGRIGTGGNSPLGNQFPAYAKQIQELVAQKWRTSDVDARIQTAPITIITFDLMRDGTARNIQVLQKSGIPTLDFSAQRAVTEASPFPPIPPTYDGSSVPVTFTFELKR